ncbi:MAG: alpha-amylase family glycosyl hydrolase [Planctomycetaceae bacterium]|nr:alpha-amylase family glycosyl hydrolase [Planctomycetaceae bacterium]
MPAQASNFGDFQQSLLQHLELLYPGRNSAKLAAEIAQVFEGFVDPRSNSPDELWTANDALLITYGDSIRTRGTAPLKTLTEFLENEAADVFSSVHVLPFSPFSSDDGFAVIDYEKINPDLGTWDDLNSLSVNHRLMGDLVINHVSSESQWFQNYCQGQHPGADYFVEIEDDDDLSMVVRPRTSPLRRPTETPDGTKQVWCTFSHDQVDLNFQNAEVLLEFLRIIRKYLENGVSIFRLDAVGFLWKIPGLTSIHLPETHEVVRLIRTVLMQYAPGSVLITETNVPNHENLSYFGNCNEAHIVYNFSLAPLLVHALLTGETIYLKRWMMSMPPAPVGCTYLNFTASHDGIGMRPAEGLLSDEEQAQMVEAIREFGGRISSRRTADGGERIYELNVSLFDAMKGTVAGADEHQVERFLCSQTVMMALEGIPAFYIHSLLATPNDEAGVEETGHNRSINRRKLDYTEIQAELADEHSSRRTVFRELVRRLRIRRRQEAFHPNATQFTLQLDAAFFAFWRQSTNRQQSIFAIHNMTHQPAELRLADLNLISLNDWQDLISGEHYEDLGATLTLAPYQCVWITNVFEKV